MTVRVHRTFWDAIFSNCFMIGCVIDLQLLHTFRVLHAQGTVTAAARAMNLSPSAVSQQLRRLSRQVGAELLRQEGRRLSLTTAGEVLLRHADPLFAQWEQIQADMAAREESRHRVLRMGGFATSVGPLLAPVAQALRRGASPIHASVVEGDTQGAYQELLAGRIDIAVITPLADSPFADDPRFDQRPLLDDVLDLVVPAGHPLAGQTAGVALTVTASEEWISPHHDQDTLLHALCIGAGFAPRMVHHADDWQAVLSLVGHGLGVCLVPRLVPLNGHPGLVRVPVHGTPPPFRRVLTCVRRGSHRQSAIADGLRALSATAIGFAA